MKLQPSTRLTSATCDTQVVVVRAPNGVPDVDLRCGGEPMRAVEKAGDRIPMRTTGEPTLMGKRYADEDLGSSCCARRPATAA